LKINFQSTYTIALATTMLDMADNQIYYVARLPKLSSLRKTDDKLNQLERLMNHLAFSIILSPVEQLFYAGAKAEQIDFFL
jgi:hypothetical protein